MITDDIIRDEMLQYDKYEYLTGEEIPPSNRRLIIKQAKFAYFALGKALGKHRKTGWCFKVLRSF